MTDKAQKPPAKAPAAKREGAPKLETPEEKTEAPPEATPRDESSPLETPESPAPGPPPLPETVPTEEELADLKKDDLKEAADALDLPVSGTKAELAERIINVAQAEADSAEETRLEYEALHVSISPVNSHAPSGSRESLIAPKERRGLVTYTYIDSKTDPLSTTAIDSGVGSAPTQRPFTFQSDQATGKSQVVGTDYGVGTNRASRDRCFELPQSRTITIDPGLAVNG